MNLSQYKVADAADKGAEMVVRDIYGDPTDATITLLGQDSQKYRARMRDWQERNRSKSLKQMLNADFKTFMDDTYKLCVVSWKGFSLDDGRELECTPENVSMIFDDPNYAPIVEQVREFVDDRANFTKSNAKN